MSFQHKLFWIDICLMLELDEFAYRFFWFVGKGEYKILIFAFLHKFLQKGVCRQILRPELFAEEYHRA